MKVAKVTTYDQKISKKNKVKGEEESRKGERRDWFFFYNSSPAAPQLISIKLNTKK